MAERNELEEARIIALRAERVRIAARERAARLEAESAAEEATPVAAVASTAAPAQAAPTTEPASAAEQFLSSVPPPQTKSKAGDGSGRRLFKNRRFFWMVVGPMLLIGFYLFAVATPLYEARAVVAITKPSDSGDGASAGLLGRLDDGSSLQEVLRAGTFINSQALMDTLEAELGLVTELSGPAIDPLRRLRAIPILSRAEHDSFDRFVEASIDIQSGLMTLYVRSPSPERAVEVSDAVLRYAEDRVARLSQKLFDTRRVYASDMRMVAEQQVQEAQARLVALQFEHQEVDPKNRIEDIYARIRELEAESRELNSNIQKAEIEGFGDSPQTQRMVELDNRIQEEIQRERAQLVSPEGTSETPLNNLLMEYEMALLEVDLARQAVKTAIEAQAAAGREAALHRSQLQVVVPPSASSTALYPKVPGILAVCLVVFLATYVAVNGFVRPTR